MANICTVEPDGRLFPTDRTMKSTKELIATMKKEGTEGFEIDQGYKLEGSKKVCYLRKTPIYTVEVQDGV